MHHPCIIGDDRTGSNLCTRPAQKQLKSGLDANAEGKAYKAPPPPFPQLLSGEIKK